ncbi:MAG: response regulator [Eubacteriales bacterium]|nr:response regulator [Eubacteriales bacterium]
MRTIIIDDEYLAQEGLKMELAEFPEIEIVGQFADVQDFLEQASQLKPDLLFIDIEMPQMSGFDLINAVQADLPGQKPVIVLVTAYAQYAIQAFEASVTDYLLKPVTATRLKKTLARIVPVWQEKMRALIGTDPMTEEAEYASHTKPRQANTLTLHCFGPFTLSLGGKPLGFKWRSKKELELLAYLSCQRGHPVTKDKIADALWPELIAPPIKYRTMLSHTL